MGGILNKVGSFVRGAGDLAEQIRLAVQCAQSVLQRRISATAAWRHQLGGFIDGALDFLREALPVFLETLEAWENDRQGGEQAIREAGYGFTIQHLPWGFVIRAGRLHPRTARATITRRMLTVTRSQAFLLGLYELYTQSPTLRSHWPAMEQAIDNHLRGQYYASVATLLPRVEGVLSDGEKLEGRIILQGGQRIAMDQGQVKLNKHGDPVKLPGMHALALHADFRNEEALAQAATLVAERLAHDRNMILHGHNRRYGTAGRSAQALLLLAVLGIWIVGLERAQGRPSLPPRRLN